MDRKKPDSAFSLAQLKKALSAAEERQRDGSPDYFIDSERFFHKRTELTFQGATIWKDVP